MLHMLSVPGPLVETAWVAEHLEDPSLRVYDCTVFRDSDQAPDEHPMRFASGKTNWLQGHIQGSGFIDLVDELTVKGERRHMFPVPPPERFDEVMSAYGVGNGACVVLYDTTGQSWAARVWWLLRGHGFDNAAVINGGWGKWAEEGHPVSSRETGYPRAEFISTVRTEMTATAEEVRTSIDQGGTCLVNVLSREDFEGDAPPRYGRRGSIPSSVHVPVTSLFEKEGGVYIPLGQIKDCFESAGVVEGKRVITY